MGQEYNPSVNAQIDEAQDYLQICRFYEADGAQAGANVAKPFKQTTDLVTTGTVDWDEVNPNVYSGRWSGKYRMRGNNGQYLMVDMKTSPIFAAGQQYRSFFRFKLPSALANFQNLYFYIYDYDGTNARNIQLRFPGADGLLEWYNGAAWADIPGLAAVLVDSLIWQELEIDWTWVDATTAPTIDRVRLNSTVATGVGNGAYGASVGVRAFQMSHYFIVANNAAEYNFFMDVWWTRPL